MKPVLNQGLPALGINRHLPHAVSHGPCKYQGLNLPNLYMEQAVIHIHTLLRFGVNFGDRTGQLLRANGEALWMEAGLNGQLFQIPLAVLPCLTDTWLSQCWQQCHMLKISVTMDIKEFAQPRHRDREIMQIFLRDGTRGTELAALNLCRMYLQVIFVSDICNRDGTMVELCYWEGKKTSNISPYKWPCMHALTPAKWNGWRQRLTLGLSLGQGQKLPWHLGLWQAHIRTTAGYFLDMQGNHLWSLKDKQWRMHGKIPH